MTGLLRLLLCALPCALLGGCLYVPVGDLFPPRDYQEITVLPGGSDKILMLDIDGVITGGLVAQDSPFSVADSTVNEVEEKLEKAREDRNIRAVVLRIDSPGGGATASDIVYRSIRQYKEESGLPVYASLLDVAASGGYYVAMAADEVYAHPTTVTGSIGVVAMFPQLEELGNKIGASAEIIQSGENKSIGTPFRDMTNPQRIILQNVIDDIYGRFLEAVDTGRSNLGMEEVRRLADGRIYTALQAEEAGLIDGVMYLDDVLEKVRDDLGMGDASVVLYRRSSAKTVDSIYAKSPPMARRMEAAAGQPAQVNLLNVDLGGTLAPRGPVFHYLWIP